MSPRSEEYLVGARDSAAARAQGQRERSDYDLEAVEPETAERILAEAEAFIAAIEDRFTE